MFRMNFLSKHLAVSEEAFQFPFFSCNNNNNNNIQVYTVIDTLKYCYQQGPC